MAKLVAIFWLLTAFAGYFVFGYSGRSDYTFYNVYPSDVYCLSGVMAHIVSSIGLYFGYVFCIYRSRNIVKSLGAILYEFSLVSEKKIVIYINISVLFLSIAAHIVTYGLGDLLSRDYYVPEVGGVAPVVAQLSAIIGLILASLLIGSSNLKNKSMGFIFSFVFVLLMFSKGSRFSVAGFMLALIIPVISSSRGDFRFYKIIALIFLIALIIPLLHVVLYFRADSVYGLVVYLQKFGEALSSLPDGDFQSVWNILFNLTFSVPVTEVTISGDNSFNNIIVALNPAPGDMAGWYQISDSRRISVDIPYSAMGELYGFSPIFCFIYMAIVGYIITNIQISSDGLMPIPRFVGLISAISLGMLFAILAPQYPLRNITRLMYYMLIVFYGIKFLDSFYRSNLRLNEKIGG